MPPAKTLAAAWLGLFLLTSQPLAAADTTASPPAAGTYTLRIDSGGFERRARLHVPVGYRADQSPPVPLLVALHGAGGDGESMLEQNGWRAKADQDRFLVVAPDGLPARPRQAANPLGNPRLWNSGQLQPRSPRARIDDVQFIAALLDEVHRQTPYDRRRVFVAGHSNGGGMAFRLGAELAPRLTALGMVAGQMMLENPRPARPLPTLYIIGTEDPLLPLAGGEVALPWGRRVNPPVDEFLSAWAAALGCEAQGRLVSDRAGVKQVEYTAGQRGGATLRVLFLQGHGHDWPGFPSRLPARLVGPKTDLLNATDTMWDFFSQTAPAPAD